MARRKKPKKGERSPLLLVYPTMAVAVILVWITRSAIVVSYLATLLIAMSFVIKATYGDRGDG